MLISAIEHGVRTKTMNEFDLYVRCDHLPLLLLLILPHILPYLLRSSNLPAFATSQTLSPSPFVLVLLVRHLCFYPIPLFPLCLPSLFSPPSPSLPLPFHSLLALVRLVAFLLPLPFAPFHPLPFPRPLIFRSPRFLLLLRFSGFYFPRHSRTLSSSSLLLPVTYPLPKQRLRSLPRRFMPHPQRPCSTGP